MTNVFISWSGELSRNLAEELRTWIPSTLQFAKPYFTPNDIEKGAKWSSEISKKLAETHIGIICLTRDNFEKPWILFEAGALSKDLDKSKLCSILFGMDTTDLTGPLTNFQTTKFERPDFKKLISNINDAGGENKLPRETFDRVFEMWWPQLNESVSNIMKGNEKNVVQGEIRSDREILEEVLSITRMTASRMRSNGLQIVEGAMVDLVYATRKITSESCAYRNLALLEAIKDLNKAARFLIVKSGRAENFDPLMIELSESLELLKNKVSEITREDEEIPF